MAEIIRATGEEHFTDLFIHAAGISEVPRSFIFWTSMSLIAACVENRVWMHRFAYKHVYPNLYTFLIGGSASGKGHAIDIGKTVANLMAEANNPLPIYEGRITRAALYDEMAGRWQDRVRERERQGFRDQTEGCPMYMLCPELANNIGVGEMSRDFIKTITEWWECKGGEQRERTRGNGLRTFRTPVLNILAGTTPDWCREVVSKNDLTSGFWARVMCVHGERDPRTRIYMPDTRNWDRIAPTLAWRLSLLLGPGNPNDLTFEGEMHLTPEARELDEQWYMSRPEIHNPMIEAHWKRQHDQIWKIAMLLRLGDYFDPQRLPADQSWRLIGVTHIRRAQELSNELLRNAESFVGRTMTMKSNQNYTHVEDILRSVRRVPQSPELTRLASAVGIKSKELNKIIQELEDEGLVIRTHLEGQRWMVEWRGLVG